MQSQMERALPCSQSHPSCKRSKRLLFVRLLLISLITLCHGRFAIAQTAQLPDGMKAKAVSTLAADQKKETKNAKPTEKKNNTVVSNAASDTTGAAKMEDSLDIDASEEADTAITPVESEGFHKELKTKYIEGNAGFMSLVAIALVLGLAFCIERIIYLTLSEIDAKRLMSDLEGKIMAGDIEGAKDICRDTRGPVASICYQGLMRINDSMEDIERGITSYGSVQAANLEKGCSWITLFIAMAPSLGFLGTVIGMMMAFEQIQQAGDISPTIVAAGMKVALITTIFGLIAALILQVFYNYILSKIEHITSQMEESAITLLDIVMKYKLTR